MQRVGAAQKIVVQVARACPKVFVRPGATSVTINVRYTMLGQDAFPSHAVRREVGTVASNDQVGIRQAHPRHLDDDVRSARRVPSCSRQRERPDVCDVVRIVAERSRVQTDPNLWAFSVGLFVLAGALHAHAQLEKPMTILARPQWKPIERTTKLAMDIVDHAQIVASPQWP